jgi:SAM-dependent methyltransferase
MRAEHLNILRCPRSKKRLQIKNADIVDNRIKSGVLFEPESGAEYPVVDFIPRFITQAEYTQNFGLEWNIHNRTQYDETSGYNLSRERFYSETKWGQKLQGQNILEVGSGSGRFTRHALETGALVMSIDPSTAVEANYRSNGKQDNLLLVQASLFEMPLAEDYFDKVFCFGVLQHTPNPRQAFMMLVKYLKHGGRIASDIYIKDLTHWLLQTKYYVRPFINKAEPEKLYKDVKRYIDFMWPLSRLIRKIPRFGYAVNWRLLVADYSSLLPGASEDTLKEWAYLDTFDMLSPTYDKPQTINTFTSWHQQAGLQDIEVHKGFNGVEGRGTKP